MTTVRNSVETIPNQRLATRSILTVGSTSWAASLVMSVTTPSAGVSRMLTANAALTAPKAAATPDADERGGRERDQHQVARVARHGRHDPDEDDDVGQRAGRGDRHQLADQRADQPRVLGDPDADHRHQDHADRREAEEVGHERGEDEADAVAAEQALGLDALADDPVLALVGALVARVVGVDRGRRAAGVLGDLRGGRLGDLVGDADAAPVEHLRDEDDEDDQPGEEQRGVGHAVARALDEAEEAAGLGLRGAHVL